MAIIGTFTKNSDGSFAGEIITLSLQSGNVRITPEAERSSEDSPSHRVTAGRAEIGAGWMKTSSSNRDYLSLKLDDPSLAAPIYANLFEQQDGKTYSLLWSRQRQSD
jgi:uncharacterized protein (DUF736 family)